MTLKKYVVDCQAANDVSMLSARVDIVLIGKAMKMSKQRFIAFGEDPTSFKRCVGSFIVVEDCHDWLSKPSIDPAR